MLYEVITRLSSLMYLLEIVLVTVLYFVVKLDLIYIALIYIALMRPLTSLSKKIRQMVSDPDKSVCVVSEHDEVKAMLEEGFIETRRF